MALIRKANCFLRGRQAECFKFFSRRRNWIAESSLTTRTKNANAKRRRKSNESKLRSHFFCVCFINRLTSSWQQRWKSPVYKVARAFKRVNMFASERHGRLGKVQLIKKTWWTRYVEHNDEHRYPAICRLPDQMIWKNNCLSSDKFKHLSV